MSKSTHNSQYHHGFEHYRQIFTFGGKRKKKKRKRKKEKRKKRKKKEDFLNQVVASHIWYFECLFDDRWRVSKGTLVDCGTFLESSESQN